MLPTIWAEAATKLLLAAAPTHSMMQACLELELLPPLGSTASQPG